MKCLSCNRQMTRLKNEKRPNGEVTVFVCYHDGSRVDVSEGLGNSWKAPLWAQQAIDAQYLATLEATSQKELKKEYRRQTGTKPEDGWNRPELIWHLLIQQYHRR